MGAVVLGACVRACVVVFVCVHVGVIIVGKYRLVLEGGGGREGREGGREGREGREGRRGRGGEGGRGREG